jgi:hypothetical protein
VSFWGALVLRFSPLDQVPFERVLEGRIADRSVVEDICISGGVDQYFATIKEFLRSEASLELQQG